MVNNYCFQNARLYGCSDSNLSCMFVKGNRIVDESEVEKDDLIRIDCKNLIVAPGFIDIQINGCNGHDFTSCDDIEHALDKAREFLVSSGCTGFCPTLITADPEVYKKKIPLIKRTYDYLRPGAQILGVHLEGPFISLEKKGCHCEKYIKQFSSSDNENDIKLLIDNVYGPNLDNVSIVTLSPESDSSMQAIKYLTDKNIIVSIGHSSANYNQALEAVKNGASCITHLFSAMNSYHHRKPSIIDLLTGKHNIKLSHKTSNSLNQQAKTKKIYYGLIADNIHCTPEAMRLAFALNSDGMIIVTDAIGALGLKERSCFIGQTEIEISEDYQKAVKKSTDTLAGAIIPINQSIKNLKNNLCCDLSVALAAASQKPAELLGIDHKLGRLDPNYIANFVLIDDEVNVYQTWVNGKLSYESPTFVEL